MDDDRFLAAFEAGTLPPTLFDHRGHLRVAFIYLRRLPFLEACIAMRDGLRRFAARVGKGGLYHETLTIAFMSLVNERMQGDPASDATAFATRYPELSDPQLLRRCYGAPVLDSELARSSFLLAGVPRAIDRSQGVR